MLSWWVIPLFLSCTPWQPAPPDRLAWSEHRTLTWKDFRGKAPRYNTFEAQSHCEMDGSLDFEGNSVRYEIRCYFLTKDSWTKTKDSDYILHHEQLHFDLTEVHARRLRKELSETPVTRSNAGRTFARIFRDHNKNLEEHQDQYDAETNHSIDQKAQAKWDTLIPAWLEAVEAYNDPVVRVTLR